MFLIRAAFARLAAPCCAALAFVIPAQAQTPPDAPPVISPLRVDPDVNGVNIVDGKITMDVPAISVPGALHLRFDRVQNAAPYVNGRILQWQPGDPKAASYSVHTADGTSEAFKCIDAECSSPNLTGSTFNTGSLTYRQAGSGTVYHFTFQHVNTTGADRSLLYYASQIDYMDGETLSYEYGTAYLAGDPFNRTFYRPIKVTSNRGYFISISYPAGALGTIEWNTVAQATLYASAAPTVPIAQLTYNSTNGTATDIGGRIFACDCPSALGSNIETVNGQLKLPGESTPAKQVTAVSGKALVGTVVKDGVTWTYTYDNATYEASVAGYYYTRVTVAGPNGYSQEYNLSVSDKRNMINSAKDSLNRTTSFQYADGSRVTKIIYPELNEIGISYDDWGNITQKVTKAKPGSGLADLTEIAIFPTSCNGVACYRPTAVIDALGRQTDLVYGNQGRLIERTDPADANGIRRKTYFEYDTAGRKTVIRVCGYTTTCGTSQEIRTEYEYWGSTPLPTVERRIDASISQTIETHYEYDAAGRKTVVDGPLAGTDDASYYRYDVHGRRTWEIGPRDAAGLRVARRFTYRDSDDKPTRVETGTVPDATSATLAVYSRTDTSYDGRRNAVRVTVNTAELVGGVPNSTFTTQSVDDASFEDSGRQICQTLRMNPAVFGSLPSDACTLGATGNQGPDRITRNSYDAAGQLTKVQEAWQVTTANGFAATLQQDYATYTYSANGKRTSVTDANGNKAVMGYDGFDRQISWLFPSKSTSGAQAPCNLGTVTETLVNGEWITGPAEARGASDDCEKYAYDRLGHRRTLIKRDGSALRFDYDALGRMIRKTVPERSGLGATHTRDVFYSYDLLNLQTTARFDSASGEGITNTYDGFGRQTASTLAIDSQAYTLLYQYDAAGNRIRVTHADGQPFRYDYDARGRLSAVYEGTGTSVPLDTFTHDSQGRVSGRSEGAGSNVALSYNTLGQLTQQVDSYVGGTGNVTVTLGYNQAAQIIQRDRSNGAYSWTAGIDFDRNYTTNGLNQYTAAGPASFTYDVNGNLAAEGGTTYTYDIENRLVAKGSVGLRYDPLGRLYEVTNGANTTRFVYDGDALIAEYDAAGTLKARYVHGSDAKTDDPLVWYDNATKRWLHADQLGSIVTVTNGSGAAQWINSYDEFGIPGTGNQGRFQYTGQIWLAELGLYHYKARLYSPTLGRFLQVDPIGYDDQINLYAYVNNDPVNGTDPTGTATCTGSRIPCGEGGLSIGASGFSLGSGRGSTPVGPSVGLLGPGEYPNFAAAQDATTFYPAAEPPVRGPVTTDPTGARIAPGPDGNRIRFGPPDKDYRNGYWKLEKPNPNGRPQPVDPYTGKLPGNMSRAEARARTHVPLPKGYWDRYVRIRPATPRGQSSGVGTGVLRFGIIGAVLCALFCFIPPAY